MSIFMVLYTTKSFVMQGGLGVASFQRVLGATRREKLTLREPMDVVRVILPETTMRTPAPAILEPRWPIEELVAPRTLEMPDAPQPENRHRKEDERCCDPGLLELRTE